MSKRLDRKEYVKLDEISLSSDKVNEILSWVLPWSQNPECLPSIYASSCSLRASANIWRWSRTIKW